MGWRDWRDWRGLTRPRGLGGGRGLAVGSEDVDVDDPIAPIGVAIEKVADPRGYRLAKEG